MKVRRIIRRSFSRKTKGVNVAGGIDGVVVANVGEPGDTRISVRSHRRVVQRGGRTVVDEGGTTVEDDGGTIREG